MEVRKSAVDDKYIGERVWLNPIAAAAGKVHRGRSFKPSADASVNGSDNSNNDMLLKTSMRGRSRLDGRPSLREFSGFRKKSSREFSGFRKKLSFTLNMNDETNDEDIDAVCEKLSREFTLSRKIRTSISALKTDSIDFKINPRSSKKERGSQGSRSKSNLLGKRPSIVKHLGFRNKNASDSDSDDSDADSLTEYAVGTKQTCNHVDCKSPWLQHMSLTSDMSTEREGNEIRPIPGLKGVNFLTDIANIKVGASYVFAPVIKLLKGYGYVKGLNLDACPYDWRVPPSTLEERDGYFTKTMERIERMVEQCGGKPVVLLCHSMGGKCGHYLLNFVIETKGPDEGRQWLDQHIHTYMPLGAAHIGVPAILATTFSAELNPAFDSLMTMQERMVFSRSLGSGVWLMPTTLPSFERNAPPAIMCKREGKLTIRIVVSEETPIGDVHKLVTNNYGSREVNCFQIRVAYGDKGTIGERVAKARTEESIRVADPFPKQNRLNSQYFDLPFAQFIFPTPGSLIESDGDDHDLLPLKPIQFTMMEFGDTQSYRIEPKGKCMSWLYKFSPGQRRAMLTNAIAKKAGKYKTKLAQSSIIDDIDIKKLVAAGQKGITRKVPLYACADKWMLDRVLTQSQRCIEMAVNIKWEPPPSCDDDDLTNPIAMFPSDDQSKKDTKNSNKKNIEESGSTLFAPIPEVVSDMDDHSEYVPLSGQAMLREEGLEDSFVAVARDRYSPDLDHVGPRHKSSYDRPPVKRIYAIYGTNLETAVSKVCKRVPSYKEDKTGEEYLARPRFEVDNDARMESPAGVSRSGHTLDNGTLYEHAGTSQIDLLTGERIKRSGDGSVPYYCLQQSSVWAKEVENDPDTTDKVRIEELEGAEHRAIIADQRFHRLLTDYLTGRTEV